MRGFVRILALGSFLTLFLCLAVMVSPAYAEAKTVYVDAAQGQDSNTGESAALAFKTLDRAIQEVDADGGTIVLVSDYFLTSDYTEPAHTGAIIVTSDDGTQDYGAELSFPGSSQKVYRLSGPTEFRNLTIVTTDWTVFAAQFHPIVFGEGISAVNTVSNETRQIFVVGGYEAPHSNSLALDLDSHITIDSGTFYAVSGFTRTKGIETQTYTGTSHITVNGGDISQVYGASLYNHYSGSTDIRVTGGTIGKVSAGGDVTRRLDGTADITLLGGTVHTIDVNNVVDDATLTLDGVTYTDATVTYASQAIQDLAVQRGSEKVVRYNALLYSGAQITHLAQVFDRAEDLAQTGSEKTVYVDAAQGQDSNTGESASLAFQTLNRAIQEIGAYGGTVVLVSDYALSSNFTEPAHSGAIVVTSDDGTQNYGAELSFPGSSQKVYRLSGPTEFRNLTIVTTGWTVFAAQFHPIVFGEGISTASTVSNETRQIFVVGGHEAPNSSELPKNLDSHITINSGTYYRVNGFSRTVGIGTQTYSGTSYMTVNGGDIAELYGAALYNHYAGSTEIVVNGGTIGKLSTGGDVTRRLNGTADISLLGGTVGTIDVNNVIGDAKLTLDGGTYTNVTVTYGSQAIENYASDAGSTKTAKYNSLLYNTTQATELETVFDEADGYVPLNNEPTAAALAPAIAGDGKVRLTWDAVAGALLYKVYVSTATGEYGAEIEVVSGTAYEVRNLANGTAYYFVVKAMNTVGDSIASNEVTATPRAVEYVPTVSSTIAYKSVGGVPLQLYVVQPAPGSIPGNSAKPAVLFYHGGGWTQGSPSGWFPFAEHYAGKYGMVAISVQYRLAGPYLASEDAVDAINYVFDHADALGIDTNHIFVGGGSAGGHLALATALLQLPNTVEAHRPAGVLLGGPVTNTTGGYPNGWGLSQFANAADAEQYSPYHQMDEGNPPVFITHGTADGTVHVNNSRDFCTAYNQLGNTCELVEFLGLGHTFYAAGNAHHEQALEAMDTFLEQHMGTEPEAPSVVYLNQAAGADTNSGATVADAFQTLSRAIEAVGEDGGTIVLVSDYRLTASYAEPEHNGMITLTSKDGTQDYGGKLVFATTTETIYRQNGPTTFRDLTIASGASSTVFAAQFHPVLFDEGITVDSSASSGTRQIFVVGGYEAPNSNSLALNLDSHITINSGTFYRVNGFTRTRGIATQTYTGTSHITVNGGNISEVYGASLFNHFSGSTVIRVTGGAIGKVSAGGDVTRRLDGTADITLLGGTVGTIDVNNVVGDAILSLDGGTYSDVMVTYASQAIRNLAIQANSEKIARYNALHYGSAQITHLEQVFDRVENFTYVYVSEGASGTGCTVQEPCGSLEDAYELIRVAGGMIRISGSVLWDFDPVVPPANGRVTFTSDASGSIVFPRDAYVQLKSDVTFENIELRHEDSVTLHADGSQLVIGNGVVMDDPDGITVSGGAGSSSLTIYSGSFERVIGAAGLDDDYAGTVVTEIYGGTIGQLWSGTTDAYAVARTETSVYGGDIGTIHSSADSITDAYVLRLYGGSVDSVVMNRLDGDVLLRLTDAEVNQISASAWGQGEAVRTLIYTPAHATIVAGVAALFDNKITDRFVYLEDGGTGNGSHPGNPVGDLNAAIALLGGDGYVVISGKYTIGSAYTANAHNNHVTLTSYDYDRDYRAGGAVFDLGSDLLLGGETSIEKLQFNAPAFAVLFAMGHPLTIGEDVDTTLTLGNRTYINIIGGHNRTTVTPEIRLEVNSGNWAVLRGGSNYKGAQAENLDIEITVNGGTFHSYVAAAPRDWSTGTIQFTVNGGEFRQGLFVMHEYVEDGSIDNGEYDVELTINGGVFWKMIAPARNKSTIMDGTFHVNLNGGDFSHLTDFRGTEEYEGDMTSFLSIGPNFDIGAEPQGTITFTNYMRSGADPYMFYYNGYYYYTSTGATSIILHKVANIADLKTSTGYTILRPTYGQNLWSPEIHYFSAAEVGEENAGWYMFIAFDDGTTANQRQHVVKALDGDNLIGPWGNPVTGEVNVPLKLINEDQPDFNNEVFVAGTSVIRINGKAYLTYVSEVDRGTSNFHQTISISEFKNPWTLTGEPTVLVVPEYAWEMGGYGQSSSDPSLWYPKVVEGAAAVYGDNGEVYLVYTGSGYWTIYYALGYMKFMGGDPMVATNWVKNPTPILSLSDSINGSGHGSFFTDADGTKWIAYHAYVGRDTSSGRFAFVEPYYADANGVVIGNGSAHPAPIETEYTVAVNRTPLSEKISGFGSIGAPDRMAPVTKVETAPSQLDGSNGWFLRPVTVTLSASDNDSVSNTVYSRDSGVTWSLYTGPITIDREGINQISFRSTDRAGNVESVQSITLNVDTSAPTIMVSMLEEGGIYENAADLMPQFTVTDSGSGVDNSKTKSMLDGRSFEVGTTIPLYTLPLGQHTWTLTASDMAGNQVSRTVLFQTITSMDSLKSLVTRLKMSSEIENAGIYNSLLKKVENRNLNSFVNEVEAQSGKHISNEAAKYLLRDARFLLSQE